jgi:vacuolar-type H+-ATPase subunit E/Vma4
MNDPTAVAAALAPVREALLTRAHSDAAQLLARAEADAENLLARARAEAGTVVDEARARGEHEASALLDTERARSRGTVRAAELAARRAALEQLRERTTALLHQRCAGPDRDRITERMSVAVRAVLGADAALLPAPGGGVTGRTAGRFADCSLAVLAARAVDLLGAEVERLWRP